MEFNFLKYPIILTSFFLTTLVGVDVDDGVSFLTKFSNRDSVSDIPLFLI